MKKQNTEIDDEIPMISQVKEKSTEVEGDYKTIHRLVDGSLLLGRTTPKQLKKAQKEAQKNLDEGVKYLSNLINKKIMERLEEKYASEITALGQSGKWYDHFYSWRYIHSLNIFPHTWK